MKILVSALLGNALEFYDFTVYAIFSKQIGKFFFPAQDSCAQILLSLAVFAAGFLLRPLGGIIFGHIGDKYGRRQALSISILCMAAPTFLIGILPGYEYLGIWAPLMLVLFRLIQGISIGGEGSGSAIFILEHSQRFKPAFIGSLVTGSNMLGVLLANLIGLGLNYFFASDQSWRFAFIFGGVLGILGLYLRRRTEETPIFQLILAKKKVIRFPLQKVLSKNLSAVLLSCAIGGIVGATAYLLLGYLNVFFNQTLGLDTRLTLWYCTFSMLGYIIFSPLFGYFSDKVGYGRSCMLAAFAIIFLSAPAFIGMGNSLREIVLGSILLFSALTAWVAAPIYPLMLSIFPPQLRYTGMAVGFNLGLALFGGTAPIICAFLTQKTGISYAPAFYVMALAVLFIICYWLVNRKRSLPVLERRPVGNFASL